MNNRGAPPHNQSEGDFDALFTIDPDFDLKLQAATAPISVQKISPNVQEFPELILDDFHIPDDTNNQPAPILQAQQKFQNHVHTTLQVFPEIIDEVSSQPIAQKLPEYHESVLEKKSVFYANRFQEILQIYPADTPENSVKRYAKILLYMLEQFHIMGEKRQQIKFMVGLKKFLGEFNFEIEEIDYKNGLLKRGYIHPDEEFKEELEFLYKVYYQCYSQAHKELRKIQKALEKIEREKLYVHINAIEKEVQQEFARGEEK